MWTRFFTLMCGTRKGADDEGPKLNSSGSHGNGSTISGTQQSLQSTTSSILRHHYHQLQRAAIQESWIDTAAIFSKCYQHAAEAKKCALHFAMRTGKANRYLKNLLEHMEIEDLKSEENGKTAISIAAAIGNVEVVKLLVAKDPNLPHEWTNEEHWPLNVAAKYGNVEMVSYLLDVTAIGPQGSNYEDPCTGTYAHLLLENLINSGLYGAALEVVRRYSTNTTITRSTINRQMCTHLTLLANQPFAFRSTCSLTLFQQLLHYIRWLLKEVEEIKLVHDQAKELVKSLCKLLGDGNMNENEITEKFKKAFLLAAEHGIMEIVQQILDVCPSAIDFTEGEDNILVLAVKNRNDDILCLGEEEYRDRFKRMANNFIDRDGNNILHLAGKLAPKHKLNSIARPDMQLQSELDWFRRVRALVPYGHYGKENNNNETPMTIFEEEHMGLLVEGEKWMKNIAKSCRIVASVITIIVFASVLQLSRINKTDGYCYNILPEDGFTIVAVAGSITTIFSCIAFLIFTVILKSSFDYNNFRRTLPLRLLFGLGALCLSIFFMIIAFVATLYVVVGNAFKILIVLILVGVFSVSPAIISVLLYYTFSRLVLL